MTDYTELVKALRHCADGSRMDCADCEYEPYYDCTARLIKDAAAAIEELQAEVDALKHDIERYMQINTELLTEPKRGEWKPFDLTYGRSIYSCSVCEQATEVPVCMEKPMYAYCPNCGAKMEAQNGSSR